MVLISTNSWAPQMPESIVLMSREAQTPPLMTLWMKMHLHMTRDSLDEDESR